MDPVPFNDLRAQYATLRPEMDAAIHEVLDAQAFIMGPAVREFEAAYADYCGVAHAVGTSSGTTALHMALHVLDMEPGAEIITSPLTFIGTTESITQCGARVVFADVDEATGCLDPARVAERITDRTAAIIAVDLYGRLADYAGLRKAIGDRPIRLIADAAQAHGAERGGRRAGTFGDLSCFSFYPGKNLGAYGDAGAVVTDDGALAEQLHLLVDHGRCSKYEHLAEGFNYRMDALQARVLHVKLGHLEAWTRARNEIAAHYSAHLGGNGVVVPAPERDGRQAFHLYVIRTPRRDALREHLGAQGIASGLHYPLPLHLQPAYAHLGHAAGDFPVAEAWADQCLSLPLYPEMPRAHVDRVIEAVQVGLSESGG